MKRTLERMLGFLKSDVDEDLTAPVISCPSDTFQRHCETLLHGDQELHRLRMKLCVADFCWVCTHSFRDVGHFIKLRAQKSLNGIEQLQKLCGEAAVSILRAISRRTFLVYLTLGLVKAPYLTGEVVDLPQTR